MWREITRAQHERKGWRYQATRQTGNGAIFSQSHWLGDERSHKAGLGIMGAENGLTLRCPSPGLIHHSDRRSQYCATHYQMLLRRHGIQIAMSGKGNGYDNAPVEVSFKTLKAELVRRTRFEVRLRAETFIANYICTFYNTRRPHSVLGNVKPHAV